MNRIPSIRGRDLGRVVGRAVVDDDDLVAVVGRVHRGSDPGDLGLEVRGLVVDRQDDRDVEARIAVEVFGVRSHRRKRSDSPGEPGTSDWGIATRNA